jgi:hypothetical protein
MFNPGQGEGAMMRKALTSLSLLGMVACSTTLGNKTDLKKVTFVIEKTTKSEVLKVAGLPYQIKKTGTDPTEYWCYQDRAKFEGVQIVLPVYYQGAVLSFPPRDVAGDENLDFPKGSLGCYGFDQNDILIQVLKPSK